MHETCVVIHLSMCSYDAMYRVLEGKRKLEPFYQLFRELFAIFFLAPGLITCLNRVWNRIRTLMTCQKSMTFHDFFHELLKYSMA